MKLKKKRKKKGGGVGRQKKQTHCDEVKKKKVNTWSEFIRLEEF